MGYCMSRTYALQIHFFLFCSAVHILFLSFLCNSNINMLFFCVLSPSLFAAYVAQASLFICSLQKPPYSILFCSCILFQISIVLSKSNHS